ncbi:cytochrome C oxidase subunit IV family protein [Mycolicibacterium sp. CBMA 226]|uniref:cytochrome C oxidase subunit IV family protein n=1 Tax=Mycolicibacterium sp. CBMA 226 TaxID=2606611 RepID=UPI0012DC806C|nr:cytochrome C oxidase subunit IV family protein [Mycolicibacterium sp. CBMA 226]MUL74499.1 cytochrome C oxidase subunit IV family protein [Mycolicibacterium sp. CBMA 226]
MRLGIPGRRATAVWALLIVATVITGWLAETRVGVHWVAVAIVVIASAKIAAVMWEFMGVRFAPLAWRLLMGGWVLFTTAVVLSGHLLL